MINIKRAAVFILTAFMLTGMKDICFADTTNQQVKKVEQQRIQIRQKINNLNRMERNETNKLTKNQQKLEKNQRE